MRFDGKFVEDEITEKKHTKMASTFGERATLRMAFGMRQKNGMGLETHFLVDTLSTSATYIFLKCS